MTKPLPASSRLYKLLVFLFGGSECQQNLGAYDFEQLKEQQESGYRDTLGECRKNLSKLNLEIENIEMQLQPKIKNSLEEQLVLKKKQIKEHEDIKPIKMEIPSGEVSDEEQTVSEALGKIAERLKEIDESILYNTNTDANFAAKLKAISSIRERQQILERQLKQFRDDTEKDFENLGIKLEEVCSFTLHKSVLNQKAEEISQSKQSLLDISNKLQEEKMPLLEQQLALKAKLNEPQLLYQQNLKSIEGWVAKLHELTGTPEIPDTLKGIEKRISQLDDLPVLLKEKFNLRKDLSGEIFDILDEQRCAREKLFKPVQDLIQNNDLIREEFKLQFQATLGAAVGPMISNLFSLIKSATGEFRGEDESRILVTKLFEKYDPSIKSDLLLLIEELNAKIHEAAKGSDIDSMLKKDKKAREVYDLLYGLSYIEPRYSLLFQETQIEQLSPGQRGALLLIFYLLVDKGRNPIILDQPEENLDNETVFNLLVPVLSQAKKRRQVIMVTHNPNLAVVCDAEQIIYSSFNRKASSKIEYTSGAIENPIINQHVVDVLEGTKPAFNNRKGKYHPEKLP